MQNPILQNMMTSPLQSAVNQAKQMMQGSPMLNNVLAMCSGKDPKDVFYAQCQQQGIDPNEILTMLK